MATENALWKTLRSGMKGTWIAQRFEDKLSYGIPDVGFVLTEGGQYGFIELKREAAFPKRGKTPVRISHPQHWKIQQAWANRVGSRCGRVFLLLQVAKEYFLFDWKAMQFVGSVPRADLYGLALKWWTPYMDYCSLHKCLQYRCGEE